MDCLKLITRWGSLGFLFALLTLSTVQAANVCDPTTGTRCVTIDSTLNARTNLGNSTRSTYNAITAANTAATAHTLTIESAAGTGFRLVEWCISTSNATAASAVNVIVNRRTTASTGGTALTNNGTGNTAITSFDGASSYSGIARLDGTLGTLGATIDQRQVQVGIIATGAGAEVGFCKRYGDSGEQLITVLAGVTNGISISVPSFGAGSLATSISATIIQD